VGEGVGGGTEATRSERERFLVRSSRDFLRAANLARFASISARRRSARDNAPDEDDISSVPRFGLHVLERLRGDGTGASCRASWKTGQGSERLVTRLCYIIKVDL
jgi:hypothetical protein